MSAPGQNSSYSFSADISAFVNKTKMNADLVIRKLCFDAFGKLIRRSPVDTGRFRNSWRISRQNADTSAEPITDYQEQVASAADPNKTVTRKKKNLLPTSTMDAYAQSVLAKAVFGDSVYISNNIVYGPRLEGPPPHSKQGYLFLKTTFMEMVAEAQRIGNVVNVSGGFNPFSGGSAGAGVSPPSGPSGGKPSSPAPQRPQSSTPRQNNPKITNPFYQLRNLKRRRP